MECPKCSSTNFKLDRVSQEFTIGEKTCVVEGILAQVCGDCGEVLIGKEGNQYIDQEVSAFQNEGYLNRSSIIMDQKGIKAARLGEVLGLTRQRANAMIGMDVEVKIKNALSIAAILQEPVESIYSYRAIVEQDGKYYLAPLSQLLKLER
ncbi:YgiT-type zinc finger domain-containing protein [Paenibacillus mucilaginosus]|uniref:type II toxin-antitoxin system MqsA family antitoxin n=1 Tax=Paenibacillus mucilaginosus TaxID=61624 RepID=UPI003D2597C0